MFDLLNCFDIAFIIALIVMGVLFLRRCDRIHGAYREGYAKRGEDDVRAIKEEFKRQHGDHWDDWSIRVIQCEHVIASIKANDKEKPRLREKSPWKPIPTPPPKGEVLVLTESEERYIATYVLGRWAAKGGIEDLERDKPIAYCELPDQER